MGKPSKKILIDDADDSEGYFFLGGTSGDDSDDKAQSLNQQ